MHKPERQSLPEQIAAHLRQEILRDDLLPGERLRPERRLAQQFGTNRNTLREAIRRLESLGLVQVRQGQGVTVRPFRDEGRLDLVPYFLLEGRSPSERIQVLRDILHLRRVLLAEAVHMAAERGGSVAAQELQQFLRAVEEAMERDEVLEVMQADLLLYRAIAGVSGSLAVTWTFNSFHALYSSCMEPLSLLWSLGSRYIDGLRRLVDRICAADAEGARAVLVAHLDHVDEELLRGVETLIRMEGHLLSEVM